MADKISALLITGILAVLGTVAGGVVKGYWDTNLAKMDFQSKLILRALEPESVEQRVSSLQFLVNTNLISDSKIREGVNEILEQDEQNIPQFSPIGQQNNKSSFGVSTISSVRDKLFEQYPTLQGKNIALIGLRVRSGDIIDSVTPIYAEIDNNMQIVGEYEGDRIGGTGGEESVLKKQNSVVTGIFWQRGDYYGRQEVIHLQLTWSSLNTNGVDINSSYKSEKLGNYNPRPGMLNTPEDFRAGVNSFISDFTATTATRFEGETYLNDFQINETTIVKR